MDNTYDIIVNMKENSEIIYTFWNAKQAQWFLIGGKINISSIGKFKIMDMEVDIDEELNVVTMTYIVRRVYEK